MKKNILELFIKKYSLGGSIESVKWEVNTSDKNLSTTAITEDKNVFVDVKVKDFDSFSENCNIGIFDTTKFSKMLSVMDVDVDLSLNKDNQNKITSISIKDSNKTNAQFVTADLTVIPKSPKLKQIPDFNVEIKFDSEFISKFIKAKNALPEVDIFTLMMKDDKLQMVIGHSKLNSNRITLSLNCNQDKDKVSRNLNFSAKYLKEILTSNLDCDESVLKVSDDGLAVVSFSNSVCDSKYYMVEIKSID